MFRLFFWTLAIWAACLQAAAQSTSFLEHWHPAMSKWSNQFPSPAATFDNPAILVNSTAADLLLFSERPWGLKELNRLQVFATIPFSINSRGNLFLARFGNKTFSEFSSGFGYGIRLNPRWCIGLALQHVSRHFSGLKNNNAFAGRFGVCFAGIGYAAGGSIEFSRAFTERYQVTRIWRIDLGLGKDWSDQLYTGIDLVYSKQQGWIFIPSLQYNILHSWLLAFRMQTHPLQYAFETGFIRRSASIRICSNWHPQIGWSPGLLLGYRIKTKSISNGPVSVD